MERGNYFFKPLEYCFIILFCVLFGLNATNVISDYINQKSSLSVTSETHESLILPLVTICPFHGLKKGHKMEDMFSPNEQIFRRSVLTAEDLLHNLTGLDAHWNREEFLTPMQGICFTLNRSRAVGARDLSDEAAVKLRRNVSYTIYFHSSSDRIWMWPMLYPIGTVSYLKLEKQSLDEEVFFGYDVNIKKKVKKVLSRNNSCSSYPDGHDGFNECTRKLVAQLILSSRINCSHFMLKEYLPSQDSLSPCVERASLAQNSRFDGLNIIIAWMLEYVKDTAAHGCPIPCEMTLYETSFTQYTGNVEMSYIPMSLFYQSTFVEVHEEIPLYDINRLVGGLGGALGLYLGLSCLGMVQELLNWMKKRF